MTSKREYAASLGLAKFPSRGRLSREAHAAIAKAEAAGMVFDEPVKAKTVRPMPEPMGSAIAKPLTFEDLAEFGRQFDNMELPVF